MEESQQDLEDRRLREELRAHAERATEADKVRKFRKLRRKFAVAIGSRMELTLPMVLKEKAVREVWRLADELARGEPE